MMHPTRERLRVKPEPAPPTLTSTPDNMSLSRQVRLRYRADGHLRFDLPPALCLPDSSAELVAGLQSREGIYRVDLSPGRGKIAIRYLPTICDFATVIRCLHEIVSSRKPARSSDKGVALQPSGRSGALIPAPASVSLGAWLRSKLQELRETVMALKILAQRAMGPGASAIIQRPRWLKEFMNDLLMLYLIKLHWHHILTEWLPRPWTHRYEWAATVYLIHLSVQSKLPQQTR